MRLLRTTATRLFATAAALAASGCTFLTGVHSVSRVSVSLAPPTISINGQAVASGTAFDGSNALSGTRYNVTFESRNTGVATVNATTGLIFGVAYGSTYIVGENSGKRDSALITVRPVFARQVIIGRRTPIFRQGAINSLGATILDSIGNGIGNRAIVWTSRTPTVLTINSTGVVTPTTLGSSWVVASVDNGPGSTPAVDSVLATVTLTPVIDVRVTPNTLTIYSGQTQPFSATVTDSLQTVVTNRKVVWSTTDHGTVLSIDSISGLATPVSTGYTTGVTATVDVVPGYPLLGQKVTTVSVTVLAPTDHVHITNNNTTITTLTVATGSTTALTLVPLDVLGNTLFNRTFKLTSSNTGVATVPAISSGSTQLTAVAAGTTTITVQALDANGAPQGTAATLTVTVQ
ncbi:MAG TPA: hypothetical protein VGD56_04780 [Gemmatirosa sp.]